MAISKRGLGGFRGGLGLAAALLVGCGSGDGESSEPPDVTVVEVMTLSAPGIVPAADALARVFEDMNPDYRVELTVFADGEAMRPVLRERMEAGNPPDIFWEGGPTLGQWLTVGAGVRSLDDLYEQNGWSSVLLPSAVEESTIDGMIYSVPSSIQRHNNLFYNTEVFREHDLAPPESIEEFFALCEELDDAGVSAVATVATNWILRMMYYTMAIGSGGGEFFANHFGGQGETDVETLDATVDEFVRVLRDYSRYGEVGQSFQPAADFLVTGEAAMFLHGSWTVNYLSDNALVPGVDFDVVGSPGAPDTLIYQSSVFAIPVDAPHPEGAALFLGAVVSEEGQVGYNVNNSSCPTRVGVPLDDFDVVSRRLCSTDDIEVSLTASEKWDPVFEEFATELLDNDGAITDEMVADLKAGLSVRLE